MPHDLASVLPVTSYTAGADDAAAVAALCVEQEKLAQFRSFSDESAWALGNTIRSLFLEKYGDKGLGIVILIETFTGHTLFGAAVGCAPKIGPDNWVWAKAKMNVVRRFGVSSLRKGRELAAEGRKPEDKGLNFPEYACHGGGFPIWLHNNDVSPVAAIIVSGLPQLEDHQLIIDALAKAEHLLV